MRWVCLLVGLLAAGAGNLYATGTLSLTCSLSVTGVSPSSPLLYGVTGAGANSGCFETTFINTAISDSLDWGAPSNYLSGSGASGLGPASSGNQFSITTTSGPDVRSTKGLDIQVQKAPTYVGSGTIVTRTDDFALEYSQSAHAWEAPGFDGTPALSGFAGHFNSDGPSAPAPGSNPGDDLLEMPAGGPLDLILLNNLAYGVWFQIGSLTGSNALFVVEVQAFDSSGNSIGTYTLTEGGSYGSGGACSTLSTRSPGPTPCNDSPYVGFYDPEGRIKSIYVSVFNPGNLSSPVGFAIDSLELDPIPEPAMPLLIGGGLAAIALYGRKRRSRTA